MVSQAEMNQVHHAITQITNELNRISLRVSAVEANDKKGTHQGGKPASERILFSYYKPPCGNGSTTHHSPLKYADVFTSIAGVISILSSFTFFIVVFDPVPYHVLYLYMVLWYRGICSSSLSKTFYAVSPQRLRLEASLACCVFACLD